MKMHAIKKIALTITMFTTPLLFACQSTQTTQVAADTTVNTPTQITTAAPEDFIQVDAGACFGFCPIYEMQFWPNGQAHFDGIEHTYVTGKVDATLKSSTYQQLKQDLQPYKPTNGTQASNHDCELRVTDHPHYTITWYEAGVTTTLRHDTGCYSEANKALSSYLYALPTTFEFDNLIKAPTK